MQASQRNRSAGFSLIELVIVVVIIGIIGAIAIPRMSRGASGAADSALIANLSVLRSAIDLYAAEHGKFPDAAYINRQLTERTDINGKLSDQSPGALEYGPYLRAVPPLPVGERKGNSLIATSATADGAGWVYNETTGDLRAATDADELDGGSRPYVQY